MAEMGGGVRKAGEEEDWKKKTGDRRGWKRLSDEGVKKLRAAPHPLKKGNEEEREKCEVGPFPGTKVISEYVNEQVMWCLEDKNILGHL